MSKEYVSSLLMGMCLMGCLGTEGDPLTNKASSLVGDDSAMLVAQAPDRELTESDRDAARYGFNDAMRSARLTNIDVDRMADGLAAGSKLKLALPGAGQVVLVTQTVRELLPGVTTFSGHLADDQTADFTFSIDAGKLVGSIRQGTHAWLVGPHTNSDQHLIRTIDRTMLPKDEPALGHPQQQELSEAPRSMDQTRPTSMITSTGNVRVLFLYANNVTNASAQAANIVTAFNNSLSLSAVAANNYLTIAGVQQVEDSFNGQSRLAILYAMGNRAAPFTGIDTAMANTAADIAFLLVQEDPTASDQPGYGRVGGVAFTFEQNNPFALSTDDYALGDLTALHEIGHVFGGRHENFGTGIARPLVAADDTWMTVMGGYIDCPFNGLSATCVRLNRWSNPDQTHQGIPLGVAGERDMESHLESSMPAVSGWRAEPFDAPAQMTSPPPGSTLPGSTVTFSWTTGSGVSQYYLYIGSWAGGGDLYAASQGLATSGTVTGLPIDGRTLYVRLWSLTSQGWQFFDYTYTAANLGTPAVLYSPAPGSTLTGSTVIFYWTTGSGVSQYYLYVGSWAGGADLYAASQGLATSGTVTGLPTDGRTLYVRLWSLLSQGWQFHDYTYTATSACDPRVGTHGQTWMYVSANSQYVYRDGWCTVGHGLPEMCWEGTYFYYQYLVSNTCSSGGSSGSCYDPDAWWWVTCNSLVDCIYDCSGQCVKADC